MRIEYERSAFVPAAKNWPRADDVVSWGAGDWAGASGGVAVCGFLAGAVGDSGCGEGDVEEWLWRESLFVSRRSGERGVSGGGGGSIRGCAVAAGCGADCGGRDAGDRRTWLAVRDVAGGGDAGLSDGTGGHWRWVVAGCGDAAAQCVDARTAGVAWRSCAAWPAAGAGRGGCCGACVTGGRATAGQRAPVVAIVAARERAATMVDGDRVSGRRRPSRDCGPGRTARTGRVRPRRRRRARARS